MSFHQRLPHRLLAAGLLACACLTWGCSAGELRVVAILPETGDLDIYGRDLKRGMELARDHVNQGGGPLDGKPLVLEFRDDGSSEERAEVAAREAITQKPFLLLGPVHDHAFLAAAELAGEEEVAILTPWSSVSITQHGFRQVARYHPAAEVEAGRIAKLLRRDLSPRLKEIALFCEQTDHGRAMKVAFAAAFERLDGRIETSKNFARDVSAEEALALVDHLRTRPADGVLIVTKGPAHVTILKALREIDYRGEIIATSAFDHPALLAAAGDAARDVLFVARPFPSGPEAAAFVQSYTNVHGEAPTIWSALGYASVQTAASVAIHLGAPYRADVASTLRSLNFEHHGIFGTTRFDTTGECSDCPLVVRGVRDGTALSWSAYEPRWKERMGLGS